MKLFACATVAAVLLMSNIGFGQDAKIMILERSDTAKLKAAYQDFRAAREAWEKSKLEIARKYTVEKGKTIDGWEKVDFSVDFRAVVPHKELSYLSSWGPNNAVLTSALGSTGSLITSGSIAPNPAITMTGDDGTVATLTPENGQLTVDVRKDLKTSEPEQEDIKWIGKGGETFTRADGTWSTPPKKK